MQIDININFTSVWDEKPDLCQFLTVFFLFPDNIYVILIRKNAGWLRKSYFFVTYSLIIWVGSVSWLPASSAEEAEQKLYNPIKLRNKRAPQHLR